MERTNKDIIEELGVSQQRFEELIPTARQVMMNSFIEPVSAGVEDTLHLFVDLTVEEKAVVLACALDVSSQVGPREVLSLLTRAAAKPKLVDSAFGFNHNCKRLKEALNMTDEEVDNFVNTGKQLTLEENTGDLSITLALLKRFRPEILIAFHQGMMFENMMRVSILSVKSALKKVEGGLNEAL